jgi:hypothetical protein
VTTHLKEFDHGKTLTKGDNFRPSEEVCGKAHTIYMFLNIALISSGGIDSRQCVFW